MSRNHTSTIINQKSSGFGLVELLVVITIIGILTALLLPAVQAAREAARRMQCANNLKQIGLALHTYESACGTFPPGGLLAGSVGQPICGFSWWVRILPYVEQKNIYDQFDQSTGFVGADAHNRDLLHDVGFFFMYCPSSTLPPEVLMDPPYNANIPERHLRGNLRLRGTGRPTAQDLDASLLPGAWGVTGRISSGGVLVEYGGIAATEITDGLSNTIVVGEQSDWLSTGGSEDDCRADLGHGFSMGPCGAATDQRTFNLTCVKYHINDKSTSEAGACNSGPNSPIQSAHPGGAQVLFADGSVQFLIDALDINTLYNLADRNDGTIIPAF